MPMFQQPYKTPTRRPTPSDYFLKPPPPVNTPTPYMTEEQRNAASLDFVAQGGMPQPAWVSEAQSRGATTWNEVMAYKPDPAMTGAQYAALSSMYRRNPMQAQAAVKMAEKYRSDVEKAAAEMNAQGTEEVSDTSKAQQPNITDYPYQNVVYEGQDAKLYQFDAVKGVWGGGNWVPELPKGTTVPSGYWGILMPDGTVQMYNGAEYVGAGKTGK